MSGGSARSVASLVARRPPIGRLVAGYGLFTVSQYVAWVAVLVIAYERGGATESGVVAFAQLVPAAAAAPFVAGLTDRFAVWQVLAVGYLVQGAAVTVAALAASTGQVWVLYGAAVVASTALVTTRPCQAALLPALAVHPRDLTEANVVIGWVENTGVMTSGLVLGMLLSVSGPAAALGVSAVCVLAASAAVWRLGHRVVPGAATDADADRHETGSTAALGRLGPAVRLLLLLLTAMWVLVGALDLLFVVVALDVLGAGQGWVGFLQVGYGAGGVVATLLAALLVGRRLAGPLLTAAVLAGGALALVAFVPSAVAAAALFALVGAGCVMLDVAGRTLLQRSVPPESLTRVFGALESLSMVGLALGALLVPALVAGAGNLGAILGAALLLPLVVLVRARRIRAVDSAATVPVVEIALLRSTRMFGALPAPSLERVAGALDRRDLTPGEALIEEGDLGDAYYLIADGRARITRLGKDLGVRRRGDGVGEIALLSGVPRTATVTADGPLVVYVLDRDEFLDAVSVGGATHPVAERIMAERLRDEDPAGG